MSIYIKDVKMPTKNEELRLIVHSNGQVIISHQTHYEETEAIPVQPHGDLIERNALFKKCEFVCTDNDEDIRAVRYSVIENTPTIIPASNDCHLVFVPPHGKLIDADKLLNFAFNLLNEDSFMAFRQIVLDASTFISPEPQKEE